MLKTAYDAICWPLLYARTLHVDFDSKRFLVLPDFFSDNEENYFFEFITHATRRSESIRKRERVIVIGNKKYVVFGKVANFAELAKRVLDEEETKKHRFLHVDNEKTGRDAWGFLGVVLKIDNSIEPFDISDKDFLDLYENTIKGCWDNKHFDIDGRRVSESINLDVKIIELSSVQNDVANKFNSVMKIRNDKGLRDTSHFEKNDENHNLAAICYAFKQAMRGEKISLCTELPYLDTKYNIVTCEDPDRMVANFAKKKIDEQRFSNSQGLKYDVPKKWNESSGRTEGIFFKLCRMALEVIDHLCSDKNIPNIESSDTWQGNKRCCRDVSDLSEICSAPKSKKIFEVGDVVMACVAAGGATLTVMAISCKANLFLIGLSGAFTVVVTAAEALRIIEKLDDDSRY